MARSGCSLHTLVASAQERTPPGCPPGAPQANQALAPSAVRLDPTVRWHSPRSDGILRDQRVLRVSLALGGEFLEGRGAVLCGTLRMIFAQQ